jgi:FGGY-family pentulose kinase
VLKESAMPEAPYLLGIDYGTGGVRVGVFDRDGSPVDFESVEIPTRYSRPGCAEQDPAAWWSALVQAVRKVLAKRQVHADQIAGISAGATSATVVAMDDQARPLRPAIMWMDLRASDQADRVASTKNPALKYNGHGPVSAEWGVPKVMWLKENEPATWRNAAHVVDGEDWLIQRLTGRWAASINIAASKYYYDRTTGGFPEKMFRDVGIEDLLEKYPSDVLDLGAVVGGLRADVAKEFGLNADIPVAEGGVDAYMGALGLGVVEPGKMAMITGSSHVMIGQSAEPIYGAGFWGAYTDALVRGQYTVEGGQASTGSLVAWFKNGYAGYQVAEANKRGIDPYLVLNEQAAKVPIGCDGLVALDYFQGNRSPHTDPLARGMLWGLSLGHTPGHVFRALLESICYGTETVFQAMRSSNFEPQQIMVSGGPTKSDLWMQMHSDVSNMPIAMTKVPEGPVLGSAMLAAVGAGIYPDIQSAAAGMVHTDRVVEPDHARHEEYAFYLDKYIRSYPAMKDLVHETVRHLGSGDPAGA